MCFPPIGSSGADVGGRGPSGDSLEAGEVERGGGVSPICTAGESKYIIASILVYD